VSGIKELGFPGIMINGVVGANRLDHPEHEFFLPKRID
tara:strand:+ start:408 stop:521 length:114 start_codon:yes stop_codon:yes gene_type:complete